MQEQAVQEHLIELSVGETLQVGEYTVTIVSIEGDELSFEIVDDGQNEAGTVVETVIETAVGKYEESLVTL